MKLLAFESSTEVLTLALLLDGRVVEREGAAGVLHSEQVLPLLRELLETEGMTLSDLDGIAFGAGPGAFTGLRLACGVAQGLAFGADLPVLGVGSLEAMALESKAEWVYACADARINEVYCAAYRVDRGIVEVVIAPVIAPPQEAPVPEGAGWLGCGSGFSAYGEVLWRRLAGNLGSTMPQARPRAAAVAWLAAPRFAQGKGGDAALAVPFYVRDKVALTVAERVARGGKA